MYNQSKISVQSVLRITFAQQQEHLVKVGTTIIMYFHGITKQPSGEITTLILQRHFQISSLKSVGLTILKLFLQKLLKNELLALVMVREQVTIPMNIYTKMRYGVGVTRTCIRRISMEFKSIINANEDILFVYNIIYIRPYCQNYNLA